LSDPTTIRVYDQRAADYLDRTSKENAADPGLGAFISACLPGGLVLDLGCGPGTAAGEMAKAGLRVEATDASVEMVTLANRHPGVSARQALFDDIIGSDIYDGIWASFSLLHAPRADFSRHLSALHKALKPGGTFYIGMKLGQGEARDTLGRFYTYYGVQELGTLLTQAGFTVLSHRLSSGVGLAGTPSEFVQVAAHG